MKKKNINFIVEKAEGSFQGRIKGDGFNIYDEAESIGELESQLKIQFEDFLIHEGATNKVWKNVKIEDVEFELKFDLTEFFDVFEMFNISKIADYSGINSSQLRQYASGKKNPSVKQAELLEKSIHKLASMLQRVSLVQA
ncbi:MAG: hypothetical protein RI883_2372 [Bacteroidota bacterium]|jgi:hypothetical protein